MKKVHKNFGGAGEKSCSSVFIYAELSMIFRIVQNGEKDAEQDGAGMGYDDSEKKIAAHAEKGKGEPGWNMRTLWI